MNFLKLSRDKKIKAKKTGDTSHLERMSKVSKNLNEKTVKALSKFEDLAKQAFNELLPNAVVVVEGNEVDRMAAKKAFQNNGVSFFFPKNLEKTYRLIKLVAPKLIILDSGVPNFGDICKDFGSKTIILTGEPEVIDQATRNIVQGVFSKSDLSAVRAYISKFCKQEDPETIDKPNE